MVGIFRLRNGLRKIKMRQFKASLWVVTAGSIIITFVIYHLYRSPLLPQFQSTVTTSVKSLAMPIEDHHDNRPIPMNHMPLDEIYKNTFENDTDYSMEEDNLNRKNLIYGSSKL